MAEVTGLDSASLSSFVHIFFNHLCCHPLIFEIPRSFEKAKWAILKFG